MIVILQGSVEFIDSNEFRIEVSAESSSVEQLARFRYNFTDFHGSLLLQMVRTTMPRCTSCSVKPALLCMFAITFTLYGYYQHYRFQKISTLGPVKSCNKLNFKNVITHFILRVFFSSQTFLPFPSLVPFVSSLCPSLVLRREVVP